MAVDTVAHVGSGLGSGPDLVVKLEPGLAGGVDAGMGVELAAGTRKRDRSRGQSLVRGFAVRGACGAFPESSGGLAAEVRQMPWLPRSASSAASAAELEEVTRRDTQGLRAMLGSGWAALPAGMPWTQESQHSTWPRLEGKKQRVSSHVPKASPPPPNPVLMHAEERKRDYCN